MGHSLQINWIPSPRGEGWEHLDDDPIVWLDVRKTEASFSLDPSHYVGPGGTGAGQAGRYATVDNFMRSGRPVRMPHLSFDEEIGAVAFTDGRHRFAWIRDHGAEALPVTTGPDEVAGLLMRFGTSIRTCQVIC